MPLGDLGRFFFPGRWGDLPPLPGEPPLLPGEPPSRGPPTLPSLAHERQAARGDREGRPQRAGEAGRSRAGGDTGLAERSSAA